MPLAYMKDENEQEFYTLCLELFALALKINAETDYCVFIDYYGHVGSCEVRICKSKQNYQIEIASTEFYATVGGSNWSNECDKISNFHLKVKRDHMKTILKEGDVRGLDLARVEEVRYRYEF